MEIYYLHEVYIKVGEHRGTPLEGDKELQLRLHFLGLK